MGAVNTGFLTSNSLEKASSFFGVLIIRPHRKGGLILPPLYRGGDGNSERLEGEGERSPS